MKSHRLSFLTPLSSKSRLQRHYTCATQWGADISLGADTTLAAAFAVVQALGACKSTRSKEKTELSPAGVIIVQEKTWKLSSSSQDILERSCCSLQEGGSLPLLMAAGSQSWDGPVGTWTCSLLAFCLKQVGAAGGSLSHYSNYCCQGQILKRGTVQEGEQTA